MDLVEANDGSASSDPLNSSSDGSTLNGGTNPSHSQASGGINIVHVTLPQAQVQSVIQPTSVIQSTPSLQPTIIPKGNLILVSKPNSVIHTTGGALQTLQVIDNSGIHEDENTKKRREILARRPSYRKILNELGGCEISEDKGDSAGGLDSDSSCSSPAPPSQRTGTSIALSGTHYQTPAGLLKVLPGGAIQLATTSGSNQSGVGDGQTIPTLTMTNTPGGGTIVQYAQGQDGQFFVPVCVTGDLQAYALRPGTTTAGLNTGVVVGGTGSAQSLQNSKHLVDEASRNHEIRIMKGTSGNHSDEWDPSEPTLQKRELRLLKNREAARECRRKKKEYIKCLENRVAVLENQNKALIDELKSLKELYCSQKTE